MSPMTDKPSPRLPLKLDPLVAALRYLTIFLVAFALFGLILWLAGKDPLQAIRDTFSSTLGTGYGLSEVVVKMIPLLFTAAALGLAALDGGHGHGRRGAVGLHPCLLAGARAGQRNDHHVADELRRPLDRHLLHLWTMAVPAHRPLPADDRLRPRRASAGVLRGA